MKKQQLSYYFNYIEHCNMCGNKTDTHKVLGKRMNQSQSRNLQNNVGITTTIAKCTTCELIYSNPQPVPFDMQDHYGVPSNDYWKGNYFIREITRLKQLIDVKKGMKSLHISAGLGKAMLSLKKNGVLFIDVSSSDWLINKIINFYYKLTFTDYVGNLSPMHDPYHLYEFSLKSFEAHANKNNYEIAYYQYDVCQTFLPKFLDFILVPYMKKTNKGLQLSVWLRKNKLFSYL